MHVHTAYETRIRALAVAVRERRMHLNLRQEEVADLAGCSERFVHTLEHAKPGLRLSKVLDVLEVLGLGLTVGAGAGGIVAEDDSGGGDDSGSRTGPA